MTLPNHIKKVLRDEVAQWEEESFPNGSSYRRQVLPISAVQYARQDNEMLSVQTSIGLLRIDARYNDGYHVHHVDTGVVYFVSFARCSIGPGADFGMYFCTRDQALSDLR